MGDGYPVGFGDSITSVKGLVVIPDYNNYSLALLSVNCVVLLSRSHFTREVHRLALLLMEEDTNK